MTKQVPSREPVFDPLTPSFPFFLNIMVPDHQSCSGYQLFFLVVLPLEKLGIGERTEKELNFRYGH